MLDEHLVHGLAADIRVQRRLAQAVEAVEGGLELLVLLVGFLDLLVQTERQLFTGSTQTGKTLQWSVRRVATDYLPVAPFARMRDDQHWRWLF